MSTNIVIYVPSDDSFASGLCRPPVVGRVVGCQAPVAGSVSFFVYVDIGEIDLIRFQTRGAQLVPEGTLVAVVETSQRLAVDTSWVGYRGAMPCMFATEASAQVTRLSPWFRVGEKLSDELARVDALESRGDDRYGGLMVISPTTRHRVPVTY